MTATYAYDPLDRLRLVDYGAGVRVRFRYVGLTTSVAQTIDDATGSVLRHVGTGWTGERLLDWTGAGADLRYYGTNAHHDVTWLGFSTGTVSATLRYDPFGTVTSTTGSSLPEFRFQSSWADSASSLSWVVTRWYAPSLGRFISEDSLLGEPTDPPSRHLYAYAAGEPIAGWDPDGRDTKFHPNPREIDKCFKEPLECSNWISAAIHAYSISGRLFPKSGTDGRGDALRHCVWQCHLAYLVGGRHAKVWAAIHEDPNPSTRAERVAKIMDLRNNAVGRSLSIGIGPTGVTGVGGVYPKSESRCLQALWSNRLWIIVKGKLRRSGHNGY